jgi:hypothetical protein
MSAPTNAERAVSADAAIFAYMARTRCDCEDSLGDLLCDLMHWADRSRVSFAEAFYSARCHYAAELAEEGDP